MNGVKASVKISAWTNFKTLFNEPSGWWTTYASGYIGDYLDFTNRKIISLKRSTKLLIHMLINKPIRCNLIPDRLIVIFLKSRKI